MATKAFELIVSGDVQGVGYRRAVAKIARKLGVFGYVKNQDDGTVLLFAQGESKRLEEFVRAVRMEDPPIKVEDVRSKERKASSRYSGFVIRSGTLIEELQEGLGAGEAQLKSLNSKLDSANSKLDSANVKLDSANSKLDSLNDNFNDYRGEFKDYRREFGEFAGRTDENFKTLGDKYGEISAKLTQVLETLERESTETRTELTRAVDRLSSLVDQYIKNSQEKQN